MFIVARFKIGNCIVFGKKRKGKDLLFQNVILKRRKEYFSTITYGYKWSKITLDEISLHPNTYDDLINNTVEKSDKKPKREKRDIYISDGGNYLPSQYRKILEKSYPSTPLYYSLSGHLYDSNVHVNYNGSFTRVWDKLREQADYYFRALVTVKMPFALYTKVRYYEEPQAAEDNVLPFKKSMVNGGEVRAAKRQYNATYGNIKDMWVRIPKRKIKYDTRAFEKYSLLKNH